MSGFGRALARGLAGGVQGFGVGLAKQAEDARKEALADKAAVERRALMLEGQDFQAGEAEKARQFQLDNQKPVARARTKDVNGVERWVDTGEPVFAGVEKVADTPKPQSPVAKIEADYRNGLITKDQANAAASKALAATGQRIGFDENNNMFVETGGAVGTTLGKAGQNKIDTEQIDTAKTMGRLDEIRANLDNPEVLESLTAAGALKRYGLEWQDYLSPESLTEEQQGFLTKVTQARSDILTNVNFTIQQITGAAMGVQEAKRIIATLPNVNDSPTMFIAKLEAAEKRTRMALARYNIWRNEGMNGSPMDVDSLPVIERRVEKRRDELMKAVQANEMTADEASTKFSAEFGI